MYSSNGISSNIAAVPSYIDSFNEMQCFSLSGPSDTVRFPSILYNNHSSNFSNVIPSAINTINFGLPSPILNPISYLQPPTIASDNSAALALYSYYLSQYSSQNAVTNLNSDSLLNSQIQPNSSFTNLGNTDNSFKLNNSLVREIKNESSFQLIQNNEPIQLKTELSTSPLTKLASLTKHLKQISESKIKTPKQSPHPANPTKDKFSWITHYGVTVHESTGEPTYINHNNQAEDDDKSPKSQDTTSPSGKFLCRICHDNSTGVHYGIFTCEGCKGFFKRTVQNKRVYSCVSGSACCPMTKEQRNRCQFCRFQTCLQQGMVLEAVREDRMPGGRNNSAIYNSYKLKYKKTRKAQTKVKGSERSSIMNNNEDFEDVASINEGSSGINKWMDAAVSPTNTSSSISCSLSPSTITRRLPAAPSVESVCDAESIQRFKATPTCRNLIHEMMEIDSLDTLINLKGLRIASQNALLNQSEEVIPACQRLSRIGDEIVEQLVDWTKNLPFYNDLPVEIHTHLLTQRWAELVLLSACYYAISNCSPISEYTRSEGLLPTNSPLSQSSSSSVTSSAGSPVHFNNILGNRLTEGHDEISFDDVNVNLHLLKERLSKVMHKDIPLEHVVREAGPLVEKFTSLLNSFSKLHITHEAYVCLKAITLLHYAPPTDALALLTEQNEAKNGKTPSSQIKKVSTIQDQFVKALQIHLSQCEDGPRLTDILTWLPMLHSASSVLLHSKMFYVPFLICKSPKSESLVNSESGSDSEA